MIFQEYPKKADPKSQSFTGTARQQQHQTPQDRRQWRQRIASIGVAGGQQAVSTLAVRLPGPGLSWRSRIDGDN